MNSTDRARELLTREYAELLRRMTKIKKALEALDGLPTETQIRTFEISPRGRKNISDAQKKRWAKFREEQRDLEAKRYRESKVVVQ